ncbi:hypothetical protein [Halobaculum magnesiiphilum]|uniref:DUF7845 domain-containing protein n=1 Tax=Halobaculum magnesiiphilum TaxID=1017351 RepID=A0A8T8WB98_9EURY|nr:hypothetical protein [Halobaculum magnesiiphilum]QZP37096.1 hypothetical protein K6T50_12460 [Halobaculum magnesiiphilum]
MVTRPNPDAAIIRTCPHEARVNLNYATQGSIADNMAPYWALCRFIRAFDGGTSFDARFPWLDGVDPHPVSEADPVDEDAREQVEVSLYYGTDDDGDYAGKIAPRPEFDLPQDRSMWEPRIQIDGAGERKANYLIRPRYAGMTHVETGNAIPSPFDHADQPDTGFNVEIQGSNLELDEYPHWLRCACQALANALDDDWSSEYFTRPLSTSNVSVHERYVRLSRSLAEKLTRMGGALHQLAMLLSTQDTSKGAYFWDNGDSGGAMFRLVSNADAASSMIPGHGLGTQAKCYDPEHEHSDPDDPLYHPKFGLLFQGKVSDIRINRETVAWDRRHALVEELEERLVNILTWAGVPIAPSSLGSSNDSASTFVEDWHFSPAETPRDLDLHDDPTPKIERSQESMLVRAFSRMTPADESLTEQLVADGGRAHYDDLAEESETSETTVYRWLKRMGDAVESQQGTITFASQHLREKFEEIIGRTVTDVQNSIEHSLRHAESILEEDAYERPSGDAFESWREKWGARVADDGAELQLGSCLPHPDEGVASGVNAAEVVQDGFHAWKDAGNAPGHFPGRVRWGDDHGQERVAEANTLLQHDAQQARSEAVERLARTFEGNDVYETVDRVRKMIGTGSTWSAEQIQTAVEIAGFEIDIEEHARPEFEIPG